MPRADVAHCLVTVRAFYLDIAQWAAEDPARWATVGGPLPDPGRGHPVTQGAEPAASHGWTSGPANAFPSPRPGRRRQPPDGKPLPRSLEAAALARPGETFTAAGQSLRRPVLTRQAVPSRDLGRGPRHRRPP